METRKEDDKTYLFFDEVLKNINNVRNNKVNFIPFSNVERFKYDFSGIYRENYTNVTAGSGIGKSKFTISQYVFEPLNYYIQNPDIVDVNINFYALEESKNKIFLSAICNMLAKNGIIMDVKKLKGIPDVDSITNELLEKIAGLRDWFDIFERKVNIFDNIRTSYGIYKKTKDQLDLIGKMKKIQVMEFGKPVFKDIYVSNNPKIFNIQVADHIGLFQPTKDEVTVYEAIERHSSRYCINLRDVYKMQLVDVQQQNAMSDTLVVDMKGTINLQKLKPSRDGLALHKNTFNNVNEMIGLFSPDRYDLMTYNGYNIARLGDSYRYVELLKSRDGESGATDMLFQGASNTFSELPRDTEMTNAQYDLICGKQELNFGI